MAPMNVANWQSIPEPELVPYSAMSTLPVRSMLVLAPHSDDEVFGCGGTLTLAVQQGVDARVVVVSAGDQGGDAPQRERECRSAAAVIGYGTTEPRLRFWGLPDRGLVPDQTLVQRIQQAVQEQAAEWLLAPSPFEVHPDHRAVCRAAIIAAARCKTVLGFYEVGQPLMPNVLVDITPVLAHKERAMACFVSQLAVQRYDQQISALNRYRAYTLGSGVSHAEAFWFPDAADCGDACAVFEGLQRQIVLRMGLMA